MNAPRPVSPAAVSRRRIAGLVALWLGISGAALIAPGCYGRNCEGGTETFGANPGEGAMKDENTWESSGLTEKWLWFPRQRYYIFDIRALGGRTPEDVSVYLSASLEPSKGGNNFTTGAGNLALLSNPGPNRIDVRNDSCSDFYLRLVIYVPPLPPPLPPAPLADAGVVDSGAEDAGDAGDAGAGN